MNRNFIALCLKTIAQGESQIAEFETKSDAVQTRIQFYKYRNSLPKGNHHQLYQISLPNPVGNTLIINLAQRVPTNVIEDSFLTQADSLISDAVDDSLDTIQTTISDILDELDGEKHEGR